MCDSPNPSFLLLHLLPPSSPPLISTQNILLEVMDQVLSLCSPSSPHGGPPEHTRLCPRHSSCFPSPTQPMNRLSRSKPANPYRIGELKRPPPPLFHIEEEPRICTPRHHHPLSGLQSSSPTCYPSSERVFGRSLHPPNPRIGCRRHSPKTLLLFDFICGISVAKVGRGLTRSKSACGVSPEDEEGSIYMRLGSVEDIQAYKLNCES
jgi:hypothetical protein